MRELYLTDHEIGLGWRKIGKQVLMTLRQSGVNPAEAIVVGDTTFDIEMGQKAGVKTCAVTYGYGQTDDLLRLHPDHVIDRFEQLADIL